MTLRIPGLFLVASLLVACSGEKPQPAPDAGVVDMHNSQNSLDWSGVYEGIVACQGCPATQMRLTLEQDGRFELSRRALVRGATPAAATGQFTWQPDGNSIVLDASGGAQGFAVGEGRVIVLNSDGSRPDAAGASLVRLATAQPDARTGLAEMLEDHRWTLSSATGADNQPMGNLFPSADRPFVFSFAGSRLLVEGGCNSLRGGYQLGADGLLTLSQLASTQMACDPPLMAADQALSGLLAAPVELVLVPGPEPTLAMLVASGETLLLSGQLTPEARFGPATTVFFEVGPQRLACDNSPSRRWPVPAGARDHVRREGTARRDPRRVPGFLREPSTVTRTRRARATCCASSASSPVMRRATRTPRSLSWTWWSNRQRWRSSESQRQPGVDEVRHLAGDEGIDVGQHDDVSAARIDPQVAVHARCAAVVADPAEPIAVVAGSG